MLTYLQNNTQNLQKFVDTPTSVSVLNYNMQYIQENRELILQDYFTMANNSGMLDYVFCKRVVKILSTVASLTDKDYTDLFKEFIRAYYRSTFIMDNIKITDKVHLSYLYLVHDFMICLLGEGLPWVDINYLYAVARLHVQPRELPGITLDKLKSIMRALADIFKYYESDRFKDFGEYYRSNWTPQDNSPQYKIYFYACMGNLSRMFVYCWESARKYELTNSSSEKLLDCPTKLEAPAYIEFSGYTIPYLKCLDNYGLETFLVPATKQGNAKLIFLGKMPKNSVLRPVTTNNDWVTNPEFTVYPNKVADQFGATYTGTVDISSYIQGLPDRSAPPEVDWFYKIQKTH